MIGKRIVSSFFIFLSFISFSRAGNTKAHVISLKIPSSFAKISCQIRASSSVDEIPSPLVNLTAWIISSILGGFETDIPEARVFLSISKCHFLLFNLDTIGSIFLDWATCNLGNLFLWNSLISL